MSIKTKSCERASHPTSSLNHLVPLDFNSVLNLPDSHTWCQSNDHHTSILSPANSNSVPVIDLCDSKAVPLIKRACQSWGMFQIINHGMPIDLLEQLENQTRKLFALPTKQKLRTLRSAGSLTGYGLARIAPFFTKLMWSEGFTIQGSPQEHALLLWPQDYTSFCNVITDYQEAVRGLSERILSLMLRSLDLTRDDLEWFGPNGHSRSPQAILQLNSYPICPDPTRAMGLAPHTDSSLITLLYQSNATGLQVFQENFDWINVEPIRGAIVVNVGDLMHILSNGQFQSTLHRAVVNKAQHRVSVAFFYGPPKDAKISPPIQLVERGELPLYRPVTWKEYLDAKAICFNKALDIVRHDALQAIT